MELISSVAGVGLSLAFSYVPGVREWYAAQDGTTKRLVFGVALLVAALLVYAAGCAGYSDATTCDEAGAVIVVRSLIAALVASQATHQMTPRRNIVIGGG